VNPYIHADTADQLRIKLDADFRSLSAVADLTDAEWSERVQLKAFLMAAANEDFLGYPLEICHTSRGKPDFILCFSGSMVSVEASRITNEALHRLKRLQREGKTPGAVAISPLLVDSDRMNNDELIAQTAVIGALTGDLWNTPTSQHEFWFNRARSMIINKTQIRRRDDYRECEENWLLLWDMLSMTEEDSRVRADLLQSALAPYWSKDRVFGKIILECEELKRCTVLSLGRVMHLTA